MGCGASVSPAFVISGKDYLDFQLIGLSEDEVHRLGRRFAEMDIGGSGTITISELCSALRIPPGGIVLGIFEFLDGNHDSGSISFHDFVVNLWCFLTYMEEEMFEFAFKLYDKGHSGGLSKAELTEVLAIIHGHNHANKQHLKSTVDEMWHVMNPGDLNTVSLSQFCKHIKKYRSLIFPVFEIQVELAILVMCFQQVMSVVSFVIDVFVAKD